MALTIPAGDGIATYRFTVSGDSEEMNCVVGVRTASPPLGVDHANRLMRAMATTVLLNISSSTTLLGVTLRVKQDGGDFLVFESNAASVTGGAAGAAAPQNTALILRKVTTRGGRRGKGRMFIPGIPEGVVDQAGILTATARTDFTTLAGQFLAALSATAVAGPPAQAPVVTTIQHSNSTTTSRSSGGGVRTITVVEGAAGPAPDDIVQYAVDPRVGTQRRRLR